MSRHLLRHIQNFTGASSLQHHWGYADRVVPCTVDRLSCEYLDVVYHAHDLGMMYTGIIWATIIAILLLWVISRRIFSHSTTQSTTRLPPPSKTCSNFVQRLRRSVISSARRWLLPECCYSVFGRTTRRQVLVLVMLTGYLTIWSFVGITYKTWITPVEKHPTYYNTRTSLGPWSDRIGVLAFAMTPLSVLLATRESILSLVTGLPHQSFNFLHRWLGYIIFAQSTLHTVGWCVIEMRLYQPQPQVSQKWIAQSYMKLGIVAMVFLFVLVLLSTPVAIRLTGYEFFKKSHYVMAMLYIGACWGHWSQLSCWMIASLVVWLLDRGIRIGRILLLHHGSASDEGASCLRPARAGVTLFTDAVNGDVVRLAFHHQHDPWHIGQHFYLCFPNVSYWQMHPFTPFSLPVERMGSIKHAYLFRARNGETLKVAQFLRNRSTGRADAGSHAQNLDVVLAGPYGVPETDHLSSSTNIICVAGGTGITYVLPVLLDQIRHIDSKNRKLELIWMVRHKKDIEWIRDELTTLESASITMPLTIHIFVTREDLGVKAQMKWSPTKQSMNSETELAATSFSNVQSPKSCEKRHFLHWAQRQEAVIAGQDGASAASATTNRPDLDEIVRSFLEQTVQGSTVVFASGPGSMISDLRTIVASCNDGGKVWRGDERYHVQLKCDNRMEW